jgi:hypothetical protein
LLVCASDTFFFSVAFFSFVRTIYLKSLIRGVNNCDAYQKCIKMYIEPYELLILGLQNSM